ncbi:titin [Holotrichia oblita]|uniref:Titin n=1 Tax=Holotrichia oblita TaxID=644536 RepID=A0ACB9SNP3_HOLOL|nr:titin [Holotrichia oblita]
MYEITVTAVNRHGSSLPSYAVRSLTLTPGTIKPKAVGEAPKLPDTKKCCISKGVNQTNCLTQLCDPAVIDRAEITTYMICAPWATPTFSCLADGLDHTPCCKARGLPDKCQQFCTGNGTVNIDFNVFKCFRYMSEYKNCLFQGYGVLPSAPDSSPHHQYRYGIRDTTLVATENFGRYSSTLQRPLSDVKPRTITTYKSVAKARSPYILEGLQRHGL